MPGLVQSKATVSLEVLGGLEAAPAARHPLYLLDVFTLSTSPSTPRYTQPSSQISLSDGLRLT
jgi:hypothetical protein